MLALQVLDDEDTFNACFGDLVTRPQRPIDDFGVDLDLKLDLGHDRNINQNRLPLSAPYPSLVKQPGAKVSFLQYQVTLHARRTLLEAQYLASVTALLFHPFQISQHKSGGVLYVDGIRHEYPGQLTSVIHQLAIRGSAFPSDLVSLHATHPERGELFRDFVHSAVRSGALHLVHGTGGQGRVDTVSKR